MKSIFLPFYYDSKSLHLLVLETFDKPIRYFTDPENPFLKIYHQFDTESSVKNLPDIILDERFSWTASYKMTKVTDSVSKFYDYLKYNPALKTLTITKLEDLYNIEMPAELRLAIFSTIMAEVAEV